MAVRVIFCTELCRRNASLTIAYKGVDKRADIRENEGEVPYFMSKGEHSLIVRKIKPEELKRTRELFAIAFESPMDTAKTAKEVYEEAISAPASRYDFYWEERWAAYEDDDRTMLSYFAATPYPVHFDGHHCTMTGIGGVASLPQYRRRGGIRSCFAAALPDMYEHGYAFSYLYPFSTAYYRKFGYEMCCERTRYTIRLDAIRPFAVDGTCFLAEPGNVMLDDIKYVYEKWQNNYNMMIVNEDYEYAWVMKSEPAKEQRFTYVYRNKDGIPKGFLSFCKVDESSGRNLQCSHFFYTDMEGFKGLMNLVYSYSGDHRYITFELPTDQTITTLLPEWSLGAGRSEHVFCGMVRVVNVVQVLQMAKFKGSGTLVLQIKDDFILQNNDRFLVRFKDDVALEVTHTDLPADISLGIGDFSRLIVGICDTETLLSMDSVVIHTDIEKISKLFYRKPALITEYF